MRIVASLVLALVIAGCRQGGDDRAATHTPRQPADHAGVRQGLLAADAQLAAAIAEHGEVEGLWPAFADDGAYLHPDAAIVVGKTAVREALRAAFPGTTAQPLQLHAVTGDASADGEIGYSFGWFEAPGADAAAAGAEAAGDAAATGFGKYLAAWRRDGGAWRLAAFVRIAAPRRPSEPPAGAGILAGEHGAAHPGDPEALRREVLAADTAFSALSVDQGYSVAFTQTCAPGAVIAGGSDFRWNAAGVAEALAGWTPGDTLEWAPQLGRAAASGDLGYTVGNASHSAPGKPTTYTKYLTIWVRQADGSWRFLLDGGNARRAPARP